MDWLKAAANRSQSQPAKSRSSRRASQQQQQQPPPAPSQSNDDLPSTGSPRAARLQALQNLSTQLHQLKHSFQPPPTLTFLPSATASNPKLDFTPNNAPVLGYDEALLKLMIALDGVESEGDVKVREERKRVVNAVDRELAWLDQLKREAFENGGVVQVQREEEQGGKEEKLRQQKQKVDRMLQSAGEELALSPSELGVRFGADLLSLSLSHNRRHSSRTESSPSIPKLQRQAHRSPMSVLSLPPSLLPASPLCAELTLPSLSTT